MATPASAPAPPADQPGEPAAAPAPAANPAQAPSAAPLGKTRWGCEVLAEDARLLVLGKPKGVDGPAVARKLPEGWALLQPQGVAKNLLDILVIAKDAAAADHFEDLRRTHRLERIALAMVHGRPDGDALRRLVTDTRHDKIFAVEELAVFRTNRGSAGWLTVLAVRWSPICNTGALKTALYRIGFCAVGRGSTAITLPGAKGTHVATVAVRIPRLPPLERAAGVDAAQGSTSPTLDDDSDDKDGGTAADGSASAALPPAGAPRSLTGIEAQIEASRDAGRRGPSELGREGVVDFDRDSDGAGWQHAFYDSPALERMLRVGTREQGFWDRKTEKRHAELVEAGLDAAAAESAAAERTPTALVTGKRKFGEVEIAAAENVFVPRDASMTLVDTAADLAGAQFAGTPHARVLDLGCGTGCLLLAALKRLGPGWTGVGLDIDPAAVDLSRRNAETTGLSARAEFHLADYTREPLQRFAGAGFGVVLCNPPYLPEAVAATITWDAPSRAVAAGRDGLAVYRELAQLAAGELARACCPGALLVLELPGNRAHRRDTVVALLAPPLECLGAGRLDAAGMTRCIVFRFPPAAP